MTSVSLARPAVEGGNFKLGGDLPVARLGYGAMRLTGPGVWGEPRDPYEAVQVLQRAVELGVDFIDTADSYGPYVNEELIRKALYPYPDELVIATKAGFVRTGPAEWHPLGRPEYLRQAVEMSLRRSGWKGSISSNCTGSTRRCRSRSRSASSSTCGGRAMSAT